MFIISFRYTLAQEHGDLINLHDWFQSFKTIVIQYNRKGTCKLKKSPLKKRKERNESENKSEAFIQYPFGFGSAKYSLSFYALGRCSIFFNINI